MIQSMNKLSPLDFEIAKKKNKDASIVRPSLSYWEDAWTRLISNKRSLASLMIIILLIVFVFSFVPHSRDIKI